MRDGMIVIRDGTAWVSKHNEWVEASSAECAAEIRRISRLLAEANEAVDDLRERLAQRRSER